MYFSFFVVFFPNKMLLGEPATFQAEHVLSARSSHERQRFSPIS